MKKSITLIMRLNNENGMKIPLDAKLRPTRLRRSSIEDFKWSWIIDLATMKNPCLLPVGSPYTVTELLKHKRLTVSECWGGLWVEPYEEPKP